MQNLRRDWRERAIIASLLAACVVLALLQYRWTGELGLAESERLIASAGGRLQQFTRAFDTELRQSGLEFIPTAEEVRSLGVVRADEERLRSAVQRMDHPIFKRIAAAVPDRSGKLQYLEANLAGQKFVAADWPESGDWRALRTRLQGLVHGDSRRGIIADPDTALLEVPVFLDEAEQEWILFELDSDYAVNTWLPELVRNYLNPEGQESFSVQVNWRSHPSRWIFGDRDRKAGSSSDAEASFFPVRLQEIGRGRRETQGRWLVTLTHHAGSVPAAVRSARMRNLAIALLLLALIIAAGAALVHNSRQARRLAAAQFQFFAGISHELRTPLTIIQGAGYNLLSGVVKDETQRESYVRAIVKQSAQLNEMVDQLLSHGAARSAQAPPDADSIMLDVVVSEAIELSALELEQSERSVDVDMPPDLPPVRGDQASLRRVMGNLILNAVRHGGGEVKVTAARMGPLVEIRVADGGDGIPPEELRQVFDPFFRGQRARTGRTRGTGLGLSLVKETIERLGGDVAVESQAMKGTVFTLRLPVAE